MAANGDIQTLGCSLDFAPSLLRLVRFPNLAILKGTVFPGLQSTPELGAWREFIHRSKCQLKRATIRLENYEEVELEPVLQLLSRLYALEVLGFTSKVLIRQLTCIVPGQGSDDPCERLLFFRV
jgi:hypothetical protein